MTTKTWFRVPAYFLIEAVDATEANAIAADLSQAANTDATDDDDATRIFIDEELPTTIDGQDDDQ